MTESLEKYVLSFDFSDVNVCEIFFTTTSVGTDERLAVTKKLVYSLWGVGSPVIFDVKEKRGMNYRELDSSIKEACECAVFDENCVIFLTFSSKMTNIAVVDNFFSRGFKVAVCHVSGELNDTVWIHIPSMIDMTFDVVGKSGGDICVKVRRTFTSRDWVDRTSPNCTVKDEFGRRRPACEVRLCEKRRQRRKTGLFCEGEEFIVKLPAGGEDDG